MLWAFVPESSFQVFEEFFRDEVAGRESHRSQSEKVLALVIKSAIVTKTIYLEVNPEPPTVVSITHQGVQSVVSASSFDSRLREEQTGKLSTDQLNRGMAYVTDETLRFGVNDALLAKPRLYRSDPARLTAYS